MWFPSWLRNRKPARQPKPARRFRPVLEVLEDRAVPAILVVNTTLDVLGHANGMLSLRQAAAYSGSMSASAFRSSPRRSRAEKLEADVYARLQISLRLLI